MKLYFDEGSDFEKDSTVNKRSILNESKIRFGVVNDKTYDKEIYLVIDACYYPDTECFLFRWRLWNKQLEFSLKWNHVSKLLRWDGGIHVHNELTSLIEEAAQLALQELVTFITKNERKFIPEEDIKTEYENFLTIVQTHSL